jgi:RNA polymerase sigma-70 factor (ECF subfamily)
VSNEATLVKELHGPRAQSAARSLYRIFGGELYGFALRRLGDRGLAEEAVQDIFTRAWRASERYEPARGSARTWLYAIARNVITDLERWRGRRPPLSPSESREQADPDEPIEAALLRYQIQLAISRLTFEHRQVIQMIHFQGLSLAEVAERTGLPLGTVKSRLHYAGANLRLALEELEVVDERL